MILLLALVSTWAHGCRRSPAVPSFTERHPNGLAVTLPRTHDGERPGGPTPVSITRTPGGFKVLVGEEGRGRTTIEATVDVRTEAPAPGGEWPKRRTVRGRLIRYAVDSDPEEGAGSYGTEYRFRAWLPCRGGYVLWTQSDQAEGWAPDFGLAWTLIEGTEPPS
jgi:hypothetical protein